MERFERRLFQFHFARDLRQMTDWMEVVNSTDIELARASRVTAWRNGPVSSVRSHS